MVPTFRPTYRLEARDDAKEINLDISLEKFGTLRDFLKTILENLMKETPPTPTRELINPTAIDRLTIASGGVTRDFIGIFLGAISQARNRGLKHYRGPKVGAEDVNLAAGDYDPIKREEFKVDTDEERDSLEDAFHKLVIFCTTSSKCNVLLISQSLAGSVRNAIDQLIDLRLIHPVKSRVTLREGGNELFEAYKDEKIRGSSLIYRGD